jgi:hypothetical protein
LRRGAGAPRLAGVRPIFDPAFPCDAEQPLDKANDPPIRFTDAAIKKLAPDPARRYEIRDPQTEDARKSLGAPLRRRLTGPHRALPPSPWLFLAGGRHMPLDLKSDWTDADVAKLIGSVVDDRDWRLEVSADGVADLADKSANPTGVDYDETLHCFFETWMAGTDFVGASAAGDKALVGKISKALRENFPVLKAQKFIFVDL